MTRFDLREDMHIHSVYSDGKATLEEIYGEAAAQGLGRFCFVDHVRADTDWLPQFAAATQPYRRRKRPRSGPRAYVGVEAKILDTAGRLDLPAERPELDFILAADHQLPFSHGPRTPREVKEMLAAGEIDERRVVSQLVTATVNCMRRHPGVVVAHLFSVLPKVGLSEDRVEWREILALGRAARATGSRFEISERWACPSLRVVRGLAALSVPIHLSTDSHRRQDIGRYHYGRDLVRALESAEPAEAVEIAG